MMVSLRVGLRLLKEILGNLIMDFPNHFVNNWIMEDNENEQAFGISLEPAILFSVARDLMLSIDITKSLK